MPRGAFFLHHSLPALPLSSPPPHVLIFCGFTPDILSHEFFKNVAVLADFRPARAVKIAIYLLHNRERYAILGICSVFAARG